MGFFGHRSIAGSACKAVRGPAGSSGPGSERQARCRWKRGLDGRSLVSSRDSWIITQVLGYVWRRSHTKFADPGQWTYHWCYFWCLGPASGYGISWPKPSYMAIPVQVNLQDLEALMTSKKKRRDETWRIRLYPRPNCIPEIFDWWSLNIDMWRPSFLGSSRLVFKGAVLLDALFSRMIQRWSNLMDYTVTHSKMGQTAVHISNRKLMKVWRWFSQILNHGWEPAVSLILVDVWPISKGPFYVQLVTHCQLGWT